MQKKVQTLKEDKKAASFPMSGEEAYRTYYKVLSGFEREEVKGFDEVHYLNL